MAAAILAAAPAPAAAFDDTGIDQAKSSHGYLRKFFTKAADIGSRAAVTNVFKIATVSVLAGAGLSSFVTIGAAAVAAGAGSALYSFSKDVFVDWRKARADGGKIDWRDPARLKRAKIALLTGTAGGAFGAWLAGTDFFKAGLEAAQEFGGRALSMIFSSAQAAELPAAAAQLAHALPATPQEPTVLGRLWQTAMKSDQAQGKFMAQLLKADPDNLNSVTPQFLKDRANEVLRLKDIPWQERLTLAHDLAETAKERGNKQAVQFLKDLAKLGYTAPVAPVAQAVAPVLEAVAPVLETVAPVPAAQVFNEAATCLVTAPDAAGDYGIDCVTNTPVMKPGDYVGFADKLQPELKVVTSLLPGSTDVPTESFLHEMVVSDGIARLDVLRAAKPKALLGL